ncbi:MAG TPA: hypothetical protein VGN17_28105 [Bryobacteraceae bacterium]
MVHRATVALILLSSAPCFAGFFPRATAGGGNAKITLRKRLHVNTLITMPGTVEVDWGNLYSLSTGNYAMPTGLRYTPAGTSILWGRTEYSVGFDTVTSADVGGSRLTRFSQALTLTATSVLHDGEKLDIAIAPQATMYLRDESGTRLGAIAIARYDSGRNSAGATVSWSGATHSSPSNPAGTFDVGFGFGRQLSGSPLWEKLTPHVNVEWERSTGQPSALLAFEGIELQLTDALALDLSAQHYATSGSPPDHQIAFGMTLNLGHTH